MTDEQDQKKQRIIRSDTEDKRAITITSKHKSSIYVTGIYYLIDGNDIVYVGQSVNVYARIFSHQSDGVKCFDRFNIVRCGVDELTILEVEEIIKYNPIYNHSLPDNDVYANITKLKSMLGLNARQIKKHIRNNKLVGSEVYAKMYYEIAEFEELMKEQIS